MIGIVITLVLALSMGAAIALLARRRRLAEPPLLPGQLTPAERRRLYKRLGIDPALLVQQRRRYQGTVAPFQARSAAPPRHRSVRG